MQATGSWKWRSETTKHRNYNDFCPSQPLEPPPAAQLTDPWVGSNSERNRICPRGLARLLSLLGCANELTRL